MPVLENADPLVSRQFLLAVKRLADALAYGTDRSPFLGQGLEYVQSRHYQPGDPIKSIDWRVTARTGKYHVKEFETPKRLPVWFVVDTSSSMTLSSTALSKYNLAVQIAGGLALACLDRMSPVGLLGAGKRDITIQPSLSRDVLLQWLHQLRHLRFDEHTSLGARLVSLEPSLNQRSLLFILSDLHDPDSLPALKLLGARHDCVILQLRDPAEQQLEGAGHFRAREVESHRHFTTSGKRQLTSSDAIGAALKKSSLDHFLLPTTPSPTCPLPRPERPRHHSEGQARNERRPVFPLYREPRTRQGIQRTDSPHPLKNSNDPSSDHTLASLQQQITTLQ